MSEKAQQQDTQEHCELCGSDTPLTYVYDEERRMLLVCDTCAERVTGSGETTVPNSMDLDDFFNQCCR